MVIHPLDSTDNKLVREVRRLGQSRTQREKTGRTLLEGTRMIDAALKSGVRLVSVLYSPRLVQRPEGQNLLARCQVALPKILYVTEAVLDQLSAVQTHQGVVAVAELPALATKWPIPDDQPPLFIVAQGLQDPGNLGTLIRGAHAAGWHAVGVTAGTVEVVNPKTLRASAGSVFDMPMVQLADGWATEAADQGWQVAAAVVEAGAPYDQLNWRRPTVLVVGNEGHGVSDLPPTIVPITIPMGAGANSLNVAMASTVLMFHAAFVRRAQR